MSEKTKNMYLKTVFFPPKILKAIALQVKAGYFPNAAELVRFAVRKLLYDVMDFSFWPPKIKDNPVIIEDIPSKREKERMLVAYDLMKTHGIKSANRKLREEFGIGIPEKQLRLFDEEIRNNLKLEREKNIGLVKEINHLTKEKLNPTPKKRNEIEKPILKQKRKYTKKKEKIYKKDQVWDLAKNGKTVNEIVEIMKITKGSVYQLLDYQKRQLKLKKYPFELKKSETSPKKKEKKPLGNKHHQKSQDHKIDTNSLFDKEGNLLVSTRIISKKTSEAVK